MNDNIPINEGDIISPPSLEVPENIQSDINWNRIYSDFVKNSGQITILPEGMKILRIISENLKNQLIEKTGFEEVMLPKMVPVDTIRKADILYKWDDYLISARPFSHTNGVREEYILDPLQCTGFYQIFENKILKKDELPILWHDSSGPNYRNEDLSKIKFLRKQREFHRLEFIYLGKKEQVIGTRERCLIIIEEFLRKLSIRYRLVVGGGCYQLHEDEIEKPERYEQIPIKDIEIYIPQDDSWLEVSGLSILYETMTKRFNIRSEDGEKLWSGCTGIGLERLLFSVISYHGTYIEDIKAIINGKH